MDDKKFLVTRTVNVSVSFRVTNAVGKFVYVHKDDFRGAVRMDTMTKIHLTSGARGSRDLYVKESVEEVNALVDEAKQVWFRETSKVKNYDCKKSKLIEKACEWLEENAYSYNYIKVGLAGQGDTYDIESMLEDFKKAMEK
jgi:hypothetical protein